MFRIHVLNGVFNVCTSLLGPCLGGKDLVCIHFLKKKLEPYPIHKSNSGVSLYVCGDNRAGVGAGAGQGGQGRHPPSIFSYRQGKAAGVG